jgi:hypothetical protein
MSNVRILSILAPRIQQLLNWTVDPSSLAEPLLKKEDIPTWKQQLHQQWTTFQAFLSPPPSYSPPQPKAKG